MDGGKRCENANVDVNTFMRFQETENGGVRKRISVDGALETKAATSKATATREHYKTIGLMSKNNRSARAFTFWYISLPPSAKQQREMIKFYVFSRT